MELRPRKGTKDNQRRSARQRKSSSSSSGSDVDTAYARRQLMNDLAEHVQGDGIDETTKDKDKGNGEEQNETGTTASEITRTTRQSVSSAAGSITDDNNGHNKQNDVDSGNATSVAGRVHERQRVAKQAEEATPTTKPRREAARAAAVAIAASWRWPTFELYPADTAENSGNSVMGMKSNDVSASPRTPSSPLLRRSRNHGAASVRPRRVSSSAKVTKPRRASASGSDQDYERRGRVGRSSRFIEGSMGDRTSKTPPREFLENKSGSQQGTRKDTATPARHDVPETDNGDHEGPQAKQGLSSRLQKFVGVRLKSSFGALTRDRQRSVSPVKKGGRAMEDTHENRGSARTKRTAEDDQTPSTFDEKKNRTGRVTKQPESILKRSKGFTPPSFQNALSPASLTENQKSKRSLHFSSQETSGSPNVHKSQESSKEYRNRNSYEIQALREQRSWYLAKCTEIDQKIEKLRSDATMGSNSPIMSESTENAHRKSRVERSQHFSRRPLPTLPSERLLNPQEKNTPAPTPTSAARNLTKELPLPPGPSPPQQSLRHSRGDVSDRSGPRKRKAGNSVYSTYQYSASESGSEYVYEVQTSDTNGSVKPSALRMHSQTQPKAKQRKTSRLSSVLIGPRPRHRSSASHSSSVSGSNVGGGRGERHQCFTATPGTDGVPPLPARETVDDDGNDAEENDEEDDAAEQQGKGFEWPKEVF